MTALEITESTSAGVDSERGGQRDDPATAAQAVSTATAAHGGPTPSAPSAVADTDVPARVETDTDGASGRHRRLATTKRHFRSSLLCRGVLPCAALGLAATLSLFLAAVVAGAGVPTSRADNDDNTLIPNNHRLNNGVVENVFTIQRQAGCTTKIISNAQLRLAAQRHTDDVLHNRNLDGDIGSDGSTAQDRANAAGFRGAVAETVAINPALAISSLELINQWYYNPAYLAIMQNCAYSQIGVWSENSLDRTVVVAVYGQPGPAAR